MKNVLVTGTGGRSVGSGILHSLIRTGEEVKNRWNVIAADADPFAWGLYVADQNTLLPLASHKDYITALKKVIEEFKIDAIVPGTEPEVTLLSNNLQEFKGCKIICNKAELMPLMNDKFLLEKKLKGMGINYIKTFALANYEEALTSYSFPLIVKPTRGTGGSRHVEIVSDIEELKRLIQILGGNPNFCIQPYVGDDEHEYTVGVLSDKDGTLIDSIVMKRKLIGLSLLATKRIKDKAYSISTGLFARLYYRR